MANKLKIFVGDNQSRTDATDYSNRVIRASYTKRFCGDWDFEVILETDSSNASSIRTATGINKNIFFTIYDGSTYWLLFKGVIEDSTWTSKYRVRVRGSQSMRESSGSDVSLTKLKVPEWSQERDLTMNDFITDTSWYSESLAWSDTGTIGEVGDNYREE